MRKKIWIDAGAHAGESTKKFMRQHKNYNYILFEPNPYNNLSFPANAIVIRKAVWIEDCVKEFYLYENDNMSEGCTLIKKKKGALDINNPIQVYCIDFSKWIETSFNKKDYIILKLDIEGAEYAVLDKMIRDGSIKYINKLYVEYHWKKLGITKDEHKELVKRLKMTNGLHLRKEYAHT